MLEAREGRKQAHMDVLVAVFGKPLPMVPARESCSLIKQYADQTYQAHNNKR